MRLPSPEGRALLCNIKKRLIFSDFFDRLKRVLFCKFLIRIHLQLVDGAKLEIRFLQSLV